MRSNNWEVWHDVSWTEFETHSAIFGVLRKELKGKYFVRGEYVFLSQDGKQIRPDISIFKLEQKGRPAILKLVLEIKRDNAQDNGNTQKKKYEEILGVPCLILTGKEGLQNVLNIVEEYL